MRSGQPAANIMTLIQSAKLNGLDPYAYLNDVITRLLTHKMKGIEELLPHKWNPALSSSEVWRMFTKDFS